MKGKWICYPGDYEIYLAEKVQTRRYQRDFPIAPFWRVDSPYHNVRFLRKFTLKQTNTLHIESEGRISVAVAKPDPYKFVYGFDGTLTLGAGEYELEIWVYNQSGLPALKVDGEELISDESWQVGFNQFMMGPCGVCDCGEATPARYCLPVREIAPVSVSDCAGGKLYDFGKMIMAYPVFDGCRELSFKCYFGETKTEAMSDDDCEQICFFTPNGKKYIDSLTHAFQYMRIITDSPYILGVWEEYDPHPKIFAYRSRDKEFEKIADISHYTFSLCSREFYLDGIKRDRWIWGGDVYLGAKIDYYTAYDCAKIRRTLIALLGKSPVVTYVNHIMDYTLYTVLAIKEYYEHTGDKKFLQQVYPVLTEHIKFVLGRRNKEGFLYKQENDWVHVDWNENLNTDGELSFEQILLWAALRAFADISSVIGKHKDSYLRTAEKLKQNINAVFWDEKRGVYRHSRQNGVVAPCITAYANIFAALYGFIDEEKKNRIIHALIFDEDIPHITTPYMQAFRLSCLCEAGEFDSVRRELKEYFGNMASTGTSTFWETYEIGEQKETAVSMYGRPFGRSQCHIWGAGAILILGKYFYGLHNDVNFGDSFVLSPQLSQIADSEIELPLKKGKIFISYYNNKLSVRACGESGTLVLNGKTYSVNDGETFEANVASSAFKTLNVGNGGYDAYRRAL